MAATARRSAVHHGDGPSCLVGRSIWEDAVRDYEASDRGEAAADAARDRIAERYLGFVAHWKPAD